LELEFTSIEDGLISAKKAQDVVVRFLVFQKTFYVTTTSQGFITSLVVEFSTRAVLAITQKINAKSQQSTSNSGSLG
jgi:hypothetical protein